MTKTNSIVPVCRRCGMGVIGRRMWGSKRCPNPKCLNHPGSPMEVSHPKNERVPRRTFESIEDDGTWWWSRVGP